MNKNDSLLNLNTLDKIIAIGRFGIIKDNYKTSNQKATFWVPVDSNIKVEVIVDLNDNTIKSIIKDLPVSTNFISSFESSDIYEEAKSDEVLLECNLITKMLVNSSKIVLSQLKYHLRYFAIKESLLGIKEIKWQSQEGKFYRFPRNWEGQIGHVNLIPKLEVKLMDQVQTAITDKIEPLTGLRHLHKARLEDNPVYKWIDATIAAELAIKEILVRKNPEMETLLTEMPSPPLDKMYGKILEKYLGEKSGYVTTIQNGIKRRNKLVHNPLTEKITWEEAKIYVSEIEAAIFHALSLLYPNDLLIQRAYKVAKMQIGN